MRPREWLDLRASYGAGEAYLSKPRLSVEESLLGVVVRRKKPLQVENVQTSSRYQNVEVARREGLVALLSVPLIFAGQAIGTLSVYTGRPYNFSNEEIRILSRAGGTVRHRHRKSAALRAHRGCGGTIAPERKTFRARTARRGSRARNPQSADGDEDAVSLAGSEISRRRSARQGRRSSARKIEHLNKIVEQILDFARTTEPQFVAGQSERVDRGTRPARPAQAANTEAFDCLASSSRICRR